MRQIYAGMEVLIGLDLTVDFAKGDVLRLFPEELDIGPEDGFTPGNDIFKRKEFGDTLTRLVRSLEGPVVLLIDAPWGSGKSTFVKMWRGKLHNAGVRSIYFDAFANDYQSDAFLAVASQIIAEAAKLDGGKEKAATNFRKEALRTAKVLGRASLRFAIRASTAGLIEEEHLEKAAADAAKAFGDESSKAIDDILKERLESREADQKVFDEFRKALTALSGALSDGQNDQESEGASKEGQRHPLVVIIDELDRCRPSFALEIIERAKHFFSVDGVIFVLVSSLAQLKSAVRFAYGEIDAQAYLEKFYHLRVLLPAGEGGRPSKINETYLQHLRVERNIAFIITSASRFVHLSLRTIERTVAYVAIARAGLEKRLYIPEVVAVVAIAKVVHPDLYDIMRRGHARFKDVDSKFGFNQWVNPETGEIDSTADKIINWLLYCFEELPDSRQVDQYSSALWRYNVNKTTDIIPFFCGAMDGFELPGEK